MGHSWGGLLSMYYACAHPDRLSSLILINSAPADQRGQNAFDEELGWRMRQSGGKEAACIERPYLNISSGFTASPRMESSTA
mmetsp:Transcript_18212/g.25555  ORF Transcript_18212/g.25555 Transcript_18212/m.25555 type:complete len:82 (-) Transcript_18212:517-762(-)